MVPHGLLLLSVTFRVDIFVFQQYETLRMCIEQARNNTFWLHNHQLATGRITQIEPLTFPLEDVHPFLNNHRLCNQQKELFCKEHQKTVHQTAH